MQIEDLAPFMNLLIIVHLFLLKTPSFGFLLILFSAKLYLFVTATYTSEINHQFHHHQPMSHQMYPHVSHKYCAVHMQLLQNLVHSLPAYHSV